ncbi:short-chain dehydrogenase [Planomonospora parontospora subsp. parontospora]|uniref:Short-chain dehydrogenase n=2 Tax=Planomonospora parontospora TaxID=58119 RepID=A0AA37F8D0_9ACTN|nr:SDR family oxidoreductase [Planomonospora parontospora]GGL00432.1 short-chain dehydrogenase [Planomonospora parontospora]GII13102.1 short-chain dehydrogenase [Planomonospora parontospora subsp. parontospora]
MIALITGATKGIGHQIARLLAERDVTVLAAGRDAERGQRAADRIGARFVQLDVTSAESVASAAKWIEAEYGRLDILVNNAGVLLPQEDPAPSATPVDVLRDTYETNVFGVVAVTNAMLPLLRRAPAARIVNMSSGLASLAQATDPQSSSWEHNYLAYNSSKSALNMVTVAYAKELAGTPIKVNAADPGYCATDMNGHSGPRTAEQGAAAAVRLALLDAGGPTGSYQDEDGVLPW